MPPELVLPTKVGSLLDHRTGEVKLPRLRTAVASPSRSSQRPKGPGPDSEEPVTLNEGTRPGDDPRCDHRGQLPPLRVPFVTAESLVTAVTIQGVIRCLRKSLALATRFMYHGNQGTNLLQSKRPSHSIQNDASRDGTA